LKVYPAFAGIHRLFRNNLEGSSCNVKLDRSLIDFLRPFGAEISFPEGANIVRRCDVGRAFYVITSGEVEVLIDAGGDDALEPNRLATGNFFGEVSLFTSTSVTADVVATGPVKILVCWRDNFFSAMESSTELARIIAKTLASRLAVSTDVTLGLHRRQKAFNTLMGAGVLAEPLFTLSPAMNSVENFVEDQTREGSRAILVHGGAGAGKAFLASVIHRTRFQEGDAPFVVVDCRSFCCEEVGSILFGSPGSPTRRTCDETAGSAGTFGALYLAGRGTLVLRHIDALGIPFQELLLSHLRDTEGSEEPGFLQLIATTRKNPEELEEGGLVHPRLAEILEGSIIRMPNLFERRRDILPLAFYYLQRCEGHGSFSFTPKAEKKLLSSDYGYRNATELREAVETATQVTDEVVIKAEHLFLGLGHTGAPRDFAVARSPFLRRLTNPGVIASGRAVVLLSLLTVMGASLLRPETPEGRLANALIWSLWEPLLFLSFFTLGRVWCTLCPLSSAGRFFGRLMHLDRPPPDWLRMNTGPILVAGFAAIIWAEHYFAMLENPLPSGFLLLLLFAGAGLFAIWYRRETWCRYACPLGGLGAALGIPALLTVRANRHICANYCTTNECYKGTGDSPGCPSSRHPLQGTEAHTCKLCLSCVKNCPHGAARLYIRPPLTGVWQLGDVGEPMVLFGFFLFFFGPAMLASQGNTWASTNMGFAVTTLAAVLFALITRRRAPSMLEGYAASRSVLLSRVSLALVVLAWGPAMAYQMRHVPGLSTFVLHLRSDALFAVHPREIPVLLIVQVLSICLAATLASICFWRVRHKASSFTHTTWDLGWKALALACALYVVLNVLLLLPAPS